jgi:hypothetical protein
MSQTPHQQFFALKEKRSVLNAQVMKQSDSENRNRLETELHAVQAVLSFYREAIETKPRLSQRCSRT